MGAGVTGSEKIRTVSEFCAQVVFAVVSPHSTTVLSVPKPSLDSFPILLGILVVSLGCSQVYQFVQGEVGLLEGLLQFVVSSLFMAFILLWLIS